MCKHAYEPFHCWIRIGFARYVHLRLARPIANCRKDGFNGGSLRKIQYDTLRISRGFAFRIGDGARDMFEQREGKILREMWESLCVVIPALR